MWYCFVPRKRSNMAENLLTGIIKQHNKHINMFAGRNDKGQLGLGHCERTDPPTVVESLSDFNIVDAACGRNHTLFLTGKPVREKTNNLGFYQVRHKPGCTVTEYG